MAIIPTFDSLTAKAGGGGAGATALREGLNRFTTVGSAGDSAMLPSTQSITGLDGIIVVNASGRSMNVFPATGEAIDGLAANTAFVLGAGKNAKFYCSGPSQWHAITSAPPKASYLYLPDGWDDGWRAAKANSGTTPAWLTCIGESIADGTGSTDFLNNGWFGRLRTTILNRGYADYAEFHTTGLSDWNGTYIGTAPFHAVNTATLQSVYIGMGGLTLNWTATGVDLLTFNSIVNCSQIDLIWVDDQFAGLGSYSVDGGAYTNFPAKTSTWTLKRWPITGLAAGSTHTVTFRQSAANALNLVGCIAYPSGSGGTGIGFCRYAYPGAAMYDCARGVDAGGSFVWYPAERLVNWAGNTNQNPPYNTGFGIPTQPHLAIIELAANDCNNPGTSGGYGPAMYEHSLRRMIAALRKGRDTCSIIMVLPWFGDANYCDLNAGSTAPGAQHWPIYQDIVYRMEAKLELRGLQRAGQVGLPAGDERLHADG